MHEGGVSLLDRDAFYSPFQRVHRDATLLILKELLLHQITECDKKEISPITPNPPLRYLDLFCGNGVRSLRFLKEFGGLYGGQVEVVGIDAQMECVNMCNETARVNHLHQHSHYIRHKLTPTGPLLHEQLPCLGMFHVIDVDPFGSSIPYIQQCLHLLHDNGLLLLTCTDARDLFGSLSKSSTNHYSHQCSHGHSQKHGISLFHTNGISRPVAALACHEFGLRSVVTAACVAVRTAAEDMLITAVTTEVVACWVFPHGCRLMLRVRKHPLGVGCGPAALSSSAAVPDMDVPFFAKCKYLDTKRERSQNLWKVPMAYVYVNESRNIALIGDQEECDESTSDARARVPNEISPEDKEGEQEEREEWKRVPLFSIATVDCSLLRAVLRRHRITPGVCSESRPAAITSDGGGPLPVSDFQSPAVLLLERLLEENETFDMDADEGGSDVATRIERRQGSFVYDQSGLKFRYCWGVYSATTTTPKGSKRERQRHSPTISDICRYVNIDNSQGLGRSCKTIPIFEDHKFFKVCKSCEVLLKQQNKNVICRISQYVKFYKEPLYLYYRVTVEK